jgi:hypothetical protein
MATIPFNQNSFKSIVNNASLDPIQGFDVDVWALDQGTGGYNLVGRFNSIQIMIKNSTETYLEFNQRFPRNLDGEIQIGWIMERGQLDGRVVEQTFGISNISRDIRINRMPRLQITFSVNSKELSQGRSVTNNESNFPKNNNTGNSTVDGRSFANRQTNHEMVLSFCKVDTLTIAASAGKQIVANRWEGMAEGLNIFNRQTINSGTSFDAVTALNARINAATKNIGLNPFQEDLVLVSKLSSQDALSIPIPVSSGDNFDPKNFSSNNITNNQQIVMVNPFTGGL